MPLDIRHVDPRELRLPPARFAGADLLKLHRQIARFGSSTVGMPRIWVCEAADGALVIYNGVTRATRVAKQAPGTLVAVEVIDKLPISCSRYPKIGDVLP
jgi:hypothetical protein